MLLFIIYFIKAEAYSTERSSINHFSKQVVIDYKIHTTTSLINNQISKLLFLPKIPTTSLIYNQNYNLPFVFRSLGNKFVYQTMWQANSICGISSYRSNSNLKP